MKIRFWCTEHNVPLAGVPFFDKPDAHGVRDVYTNAMWCPNGDIEVKVPTCHSKWWIGSYDEHERRREVDETTEIVDLPSAEEYIADVLTRRSYDSET